LPESRVQVAFSYDYYNEAVTLNVHIRNAIFGSEKVGLAILKAILITGNESITLGFKLPSRELSVRLM